MSFLQSVTKGIANFASLNAGVVIGSQTTLRVACYRQPRPMPHQMARLLDSPLRMRYRNPVDLLGQFGIAADMTVLDIGSGAGTFTVDMARMVGKEGKVHAVDIQDEMVIKTCERVQAAGVDARVHCHHSSAESLPLPDESVDLAILIATIAEFSDKAAALNEIRRVLKPGGRVAVSEELPDPAYVPAVVVSQWLEDAGLRFIGKSGNFFCYHLLYSKGE